MVTRGRGELMFHCRTHAWDSDEREKRRQDGDKRETRGEKTGW